ncbi:transglycosylase family protein [Streptomyces sp. NPDC050610]|uniref:transglycosylase family protein n=1 Tax=Streptomyces sp. NPDC050610 TaxID=3157097 RepID=UPI00341B3088
MRTGNGRHRRPRQVPAIVVAAGVTGAGIAMPLLAATGANAADAATWDRVAQCESGGTWSADAGNDFYGGLQISQSTWDLYGGRAYAPRPDLASRAQQIAVAQKILEGQGTKPWSGCAVSSGLNRGSAAPGVDPGSTQTPSSEPSAQSPSPSHSSDPSQKPSGEDKGEGKDKSESKDKGKGRTEPGKADSGKGGSSATPSGKGDGEKGSGATGADGSSPSGTPEPGGKPSQTPSTTPSEPTEPSTDPTTSTTGSPTSGEGRHRGGTDEGEKGGEGSKGDDGTGSSAQDDAGRSGGGRHASRGGESRGGESRAGNSSRTPQQAPHDYTVRSGDSLSVIAEEHSVAGGWTSLYERNHGTVGSDPDLIFPGQKLDLGT